MSAIKVHIRLGGRKSAVCASRSQNYVTLDGERSGSTPWPWIATDYQIIEALCPRCARTKAGAKLIEFYAKVRHEREEAWLSIPEPLRLAIQTASGGNNTVIRCDVPGYSSRLGNCVSRLCGELGYTKKRLGEALLAAGWNAICGYPIPAQWANSADSAATRSPELTTDA